MNKVDLPIGTIVLLKDSTKRLMITGYYLKEEHDDQIYDYCGCFYPEGLIRTDQVALFNQNQIERVYFLGFSDIEQQQFFNTLKINIQQKNMEIPVLKKDSDNFTEE